MRMFWKRSAQPETRESYTDLEVARLQRRAAGGVASIDETASVVGGVRAIAAAFSVAMVKPEGLASTLTPPVLRDMAATLLLRGNWVADLEISPFGYFMLHKAADFDVSRGGADPATWLYQLDMPGPGGTETRYRTQPGVIHILMNPGQYEPWRGRSPLHQAGLTSAALANIERSLGYEGNAPVAHLLPVPDGSTDAQLEDLRGNIRQAHGRIITTETTNAGYGQGSAAAPKQDLVSKRIGPEIPQSSLLLQAQASAAMLLALGIPPALLGDTGPGAREGYRLLLVSAVADLAALMEAELRAKLELDVELGFARTAALDSEGRSRAVRNLVEAEVSVDEAMAIAGLRRR